MFIKLPFKLTVISEVAMYYHPDSGVLFEKVNHSQHSKEGIYLRGATFQPSFVLFHRGFFFPGWPKPFFFFGVLLAIS